MSWIKRLFGRAEPADAEQTPPSDSPQHPTLRPVLLQFIQAPDLPTCRRVLLSHPELLSDEAIPAIDQIAETRSLMSEENAQRFDQRRELLQQCRERGVDAVFSDLDAPTPSVPHDQPEVMPHPQRDEQEEPDTELQPPPPTEEVEAADEFAEMMERIRRENPQAAAGLDRALATLMGEIVSGPRSLAEETDVECGECDYSYRTEP